MSWILKSLKPILSVAVILCATNSNSAQTASISLGSGKLEQGQPVEVTADNLSVEQETNSAVFEGNAKVSQGLIRLTADKITVFYDADLGLISTVKAEKNVTFTNGAEIAEAQSGIYRLADGILILGGNVVLVQGQNAISGDTLTLDLNTTKGVFQGNVKTIFVPKTSE